MRTTKIKSDQKCQPQQGLKQMANGFQVNKMFIRFIRVQKYYCLSLAIHFLSTVLYYQLDFQGKEHSANLTLWTLNFISILVILLCILSQRCYNDWKNCETMYLQTKTIKNLVIDSVIILIQPYQFINQVLINNYNYQYQSNSDYKLNYVLVIASLLKLTLFLPSLMSMLKLRNPRSSRICNFYGSTNSNLYVIKCYFKIMPIRLVSFIFLSGILAFALSFRVTERNKNFNNENSFEYYQNSIWFAAITVTTVGYGEFYPLTMLGRLVVSLCAFCGSMVTSIMVLVLTKTFQLDQSEMRALRLLNTLEQKKQIKRCSAEYLRRALWRVWTNYKQMINIPETYEQRKLRNVFQEKIKQSKFGDKDIDVAQQMNAQFDKLQSDLQGLKQNCDMIIKHLSSNYMLDIEEIKGAAKKKRSSYSH